MRRKQETPQGSAFPSSKSSNHRLRGEATLRKGLGPVLFLTFIFFFNFVARQIAGPLLPEMELELNLSHTQSGLFILIMGFGFFISQISAAFLAAKWGYRRCILMSLWGTALVVATIGFLNSAWSLYLGFLGLGVAGGLYVPTGISLITVLIRPQDWGKAMGIHELAPNLALITVPFMATLALAAGSWRLGYLSVAVVLAILGGIYALTGVDSRERPTPPELSRVRGIVTNPSFWCIGILLSLAVGVETGVYAMIPLFLVNEKAFDLADANQLLGLSRIPGLIMVLLSGWLSDRLSPTNTISIALGVTGSAIILMGVGPRGLLVPAVYLQAAATACLFPPIISVASQISTPENRTLMLSLSLAVAPVIGGGLLPAGIALAGDLGSFGAGLVGAGILTTAGMGLVAMLNRNGRDRIN